MRGADHPDPRRGKAASLRRRHGDSPVRKAPKRRRRRGEPPPDLRHKGSLDL